MGGGQWSDMALLCKPACRAVLFTGDFFGATQLMFLTLGGNSIVTVDSSAFKNLHAMNVAPEEYAHLANKWNGTDGDGDGKPYVDTPSPGSPLPNVPALFCSPPHHHHHHTHTHTAKHHTPLCEQRARTSDE